MPVSSSPCLHCVHGNWLESESPDGGVCSHPLIGEGRDLCEPLADITERLMVFSAFGRGACPWEELPPIPGLDE